MKLGNVLFWTMLMIMFMPGIVVLIPLYMEVARTGLANNFAPAILIYTAINIPYGTYLLRSNFRVDPQLGRRGRAGRWRELDQGLLARDSADRPTRASSRSRILTFLNIWNDLFISLVLLHAPNTEMVTPDARPAEREVHVRHSRLDGGAVARGRSRRCCSTR